MVREQKCDGMKLRRSLRRRFGVESLETRQVLSSVSTIMAMDPTASRMIGQVATGRVMVLEGQTIPNAMVRLHVGKTTEFGHSNASGHFQFKVHERSGTYTANIKARNRSGQVSTASMPMIQGDAVVAWIDTMIEVIKADIANVGLASRTLAMVSAAVYDAVNDIQHTGSVFKVDVKAPKGASASAAASEAAYTVLSSLDPDMAPLLGVRMAQSLAAVPSASACRRRAGRPRSRPGDARLARQ